MKKKFIVNGQVYEIPESEVSAFLKDFPNAQEARSYEVKGQKYNIPVSEADAFETEMGLKKKENPVSQKSTTSSPASDSDGQSTSKINWVDRTFATPKPIAQEDGAVYTPENVSVYNREFEQKTGHKEFDLSAPGEATNILDTKRASKKKEDYEQRLFLKNKTIEDLEINPVIAKVQKGIATADELAALYNKPYGKKIVADIVTQQAPEFGTLGLGSDVFRNEEKWEDIAKTLQVKNRPLGVNEQNQDLFRLDSEVANTLNGLQLESIKIAPGTRGQETEKIKDVFGAIDTNSIEALAEAAAGIQLADKLYDKEGKEINKGDILDKIATKQFFLSSQKNLHPEILSLSDNINAGVVKVNFGRERGEEIPEGEYAKFDELNKKHFELGLNFIKESEPGRYKNIVRALKERNTIADTDFKEVAELGQQVYNQKVFVDGASNPESIGTETDIKYDTYQTKKAEYAKVLSEEIKSLGYKNMAKVPQKAIEIAASRHPELTNKEIINDIKLDEKRGGYGITKGGVLNAFFRGVSQPIKGINSTFNAIFDSPVDNYLNSKRLDYGDQNIADKKGRYSGELPSERGNIFNDIVEGTGQFIPQVFLARGIGNLIKAPVGSLLSRVNPRAALTAGQGSNIAAYPGTFVSTFMQSYGDGYTDMLQKTGDVKTAQLVGAIDGTAAAAFELFLPDVKIAEQMMGVLKEAKDDLAKSIISLVEKGASKEAAKPFIKEFVTKAGSIMSKEIAEEDATAIVDYFTEAIFSPGTIKDRDLAKELWETTKQTALSMVVPAVLGAGGSAQQNKPFTQDGLNAAAINFQEYKDVLDNSLANKAISQDEYNQSVQVLSTHRNSLKEAPVSDSEGQELPDQKQLDYAYLETLRKINQEKADKETSPVQKKFYEDKANEAVKKQEEIFFVKKPEVAAEAVVEPANTEAVSAPVKFENDEQILAKIKSSERVTDLEKGEELQYFIDKTADAPSLAAERFGQDVVDELLPRIPTSLLTKKLATLTAIDETNPDAVALKNIINGRVSAQEANEINESVPEITESLNPVLERMNNAEYINESEIMPATDGLYDLLDRIDNSSMSEEQKQSHANLIEPLIQKLEGYEFTTTTQTGTVTEKVPTGRTNKTQRTIKPALEQSAGSTVTVRTQDGNQARGTLTIKDGNYVVDVPRGTQRVLGEKAITDRDLTLPETEEMENPIQFDADGNVQSVTVKTRNGNLVTIENPEVALDIAIQVQADARRDVPDGVFQEIYDEVVKTIPVEVLRSTGLPINQTQGGQNAVQEQSTTEGVLRNEGVRGEGGLPPVGQGNQESQAAAAGQEAVVNLVPDDEYNNFIDKGQVTPERLNSIAEKVKNKEPLSDRETAIFTDKTGEINKIISGNATTQSSDTKGDGTVPPGAPPPASPNEGGDYEVSGEDVTGITHAQTEATRERFSLPEYDKNPETVAEWDEQAAERIAEGYNIEELLTKLQKGTMPTAVEQRIMLKYIASLEAKIDQDPSNENLSELKRAVELSDRVGGSDIGKALVARKGTIHRDDSLASFFLREMEENGVNELTEDQKATIKKEYADIKAANEALKQRVDCLQEENARIKAGEVVSKERKRQRQGKKTATDFKTERDNIAESIKEKLAKARQDTSVTIVPYAKELIAIAPDVVKLVRSYVEEGITKLSDIIDNIHPLLQGDIPEITKKDVQDIIAGVYNAPRATKNELVAQLRDLRTQAQLLNQLEALENEEVPITERAKRKRNEEIADLRRRIKENDLVKVEDAKRRVNASIDRIQKQIASGDFADKKSVPIKLDKEGLELQDKLIKLKQDREVRILKEKYAKRSSFEKNKDRVLQFSNVPRSIMASMDFSAPLRQAFIATLANPKLAFKSGVEMFKSALSQKNFDRWFDALKNDPRYDLMKENRLAVTDPKNPSLTAREEEYMNNLAEKIPFFGKLIKASERAYVQYLNKMRVDIFNQYADRFEEQGKTMDNSPELYKKMAGYVNNITGRGNMGKLENSAPVLNALFFSPRLIASRLNLMNPLYVGALPKEIRNSYFKDILKMVGFNLSVISLISLASDDDDDDKVTIEEDPRSSDFGKLRQGNTRWDVWGGFQPYIRLISQIAMGSKKTTDGKVVEFKSGGGGLFGKDYDKALFTFLRGKLAPIPGGAINVVRGENIVGEKVTVGSQLKEFVMPLNYTGIEKAMQDQGVKALFTVGLPATFGVGTQTFEPRK